LARANEICRRRAFFQRLRAAAIKLFAAHGFNDVSISQIVALTGVDKALVYHYYGGKEGLHAAALQEVYRRPDTAEQRAIESGGSTRAKLVNLLAAMSKFLEENPDHVRMLLWENLGKGRHLEPRAHLLGKSFFPRFEQIIENGIKAGELRPDLVPQHLFINFIGLIFVYHSNRRSLARELQLDLDDPRVRAEGLRQITRLVFAGIRRK
jgi:TetR/AcrR family transcriptional regulator